MTDSREAPGAAPAPALTVNQRVVLVMAYSANSIGSPLVLDCAAVRAFGTERAQRTIDELKGLGLLYAVCETEDSPAGWCLTTAGDEAAEPLWKADSEERRNAKPDPAPAGDPAPAPAGYLTEDDLTRLKAILAERDGSKNPVKRYETGRELLQAVPALVATVERLREAIWPGLPKFVPTDAAPQQDFHEAVAEALRTQAGEAEQYRQVVEDGKRLPLPEFSQDPAFCAFVLGTLEKDRDKLAAFKKYVHERLDQAGVSADPESPHKAAGCRIGGRLDELIGRRDRLRAALQDVVRAWLYETNQGDGIMEAHAGALNAARAALATTPDTLATA